MKITKSIALWLTFYVVVAILFFTTSIISPESKAGQVYSAFIYLSFPLLLIGFFSNRYLPIRVWLVGGERNYWRSVAEGVVIGSIFVLSLIFGTQFSVLSPLAIPQILTGASTIGLLLGLSIFVAEPEETLRASIIHPSLREALASSRAYYLLFLLGIVFYTVLPVQWPGLIFMGAGVVTFMMARNLRLSKGMVTLGALAFSGLFFASLHLLAYGLNYNALFSAFLFAVIVDFRNGQNQSTVTSRMAHVTNNAVSGSAMAGLGPIVGFVVVAIYAVFYWFISKGEVAGVKA